MNSLRCTDPCHSYTKIRNKNKLISVWNCFSPLCCKSSDKMWMCCMTLQSISQDIQFKCSFPHYSCAGQKFLIFFHFSGKVTAAKIIGVWSSNYLSSLKLEILSRMVILITGTVKISFKRRERMLRNISNTANLWLHAMMEVTLRI